MSDWVKLLIAVLGGGGLAGIINGVISPLIRRDAIGAQVEKDRVSAAMQIVNELQEEVKSARQETREVTKDAQEARRIIGRLDTEVSALRGRVSTIMEWIHEPDMTMERLRFRVPRPVGMNGDGKEKRND